MAKIFWGKKKKKGKGKKGRNLRFKGGSVEQSAATDQGLSCPEEFISSNPVPADFFLCWQSSSFIYIKCSQACEAQEGRSRLHALRSPSRMGCTKAIATPGAAAPMAQGTSHCSLPAPGTAWSTQTRQHSALHTRQLIHNTRKSCTDNCVECVCNGKR